MRDKIKATDYLTEISDDEIVRCKRYLFFSK